MRLNKAEACEDMSVIINAKFSAKRLPRLPDYVLSNLYAVRNNDHRLRPSAISDSLESNFARMDNNSVYHREERLMLRDLREKLVNMRH
jgi:hypothetical protein